MGGSNPEQTVQEVDPVLRRGVAALARVLDCRSFVMGEALTLADIVAVFTFPIAAMVTRKVYGRDLLESFPELASVLASLSERPTVKLLDAESRAGMEAFQARLRKRG
jgi:glutathione S-transferase